MDIELEECTAGGYKARFDTDRFDEIADQVRAEVDVAVDTDHMLVWHEDGVKCSFVRSSGVLLVRTGERAEARRIIDQVTG